MARNRFVLDPSVRVELIATRGDEVFKKEMTLLEAKNKPRKKGWHYRIYQIGFSQFKTIKNEKA